jgi:hypothetical protein
MGLSTNRRLQPAHLSRHADQWGPGRYLVIPRWVVRGQPAGCGVAPISRDYNSALRSPCGSERVKLKTWHRRATYRLHNPTIPTLTTGNHDG